jgi:hypothetical protein
VTARLPPRVAGALLMAAGHGFSVSSVTYGVGVEERGDPAAGIVRGRLVIARVGYARQDVGDLARLTAGLVRACPASGYTARPSARLMLKSTEFRQAFARRSR